MGKAVLKKIFYLMLGIAVLWFLFAYEPEAKIVDDGRIHLEYWTMTGQKDQISYAVDHFNQMQDRIVVKQVVVPWQEHEKKVLTAILSGNPPDVMTQLSPVSQWASRMALIPLDDFIRRDEYDTTVFFSALWSEMNWRGRVFGLPARTASYAFFYNNEMFRQAGLDPARPPRTWHDVREYAKRLVKYDQKGNITQMGFVPEYGFLPGHGDLAAAIVIAWQRGAVFMTDNGTRASLTNEPVVGALKWVTDFYQDYDRDKISAFIAGFGYAEQHAFLADKMAMMMLANTFIENIADYRPDMDYSVCIIPSDEGNPSASSSGSWWLSIPRGAKNPEEAWEFMKYMVSAETQLAETQNTEESLFPTSRPAAYSPVFMKDSATSIFVRQMEVAHSPAVIPLVHGVFWREYMGARERAVKGLQTPLEALRQAEYQIQLELDKAVRYDLYVHSKMEYEHIDIEK